MRKMTDRIDLENAENATNIAGESFETGLTSGKIVMNTPGDAEMLHARVLPQHVFNGVPVCNIPERATPSPCPLSPSELPQFQVIPMAVVSC